MGGNRDAGQTGTAKREHSAGQIASDLVGLPLGPLVFRTILDTLLFTPRIARDVIAGTNAYFSPLRLFISLMGLTFTIIAFFGLPNMFSLETMMAPDGWDRVRSALAEQGHTFEEVSATVSRWGGLLNWPILVISMIPYLVVIKLFRPSISWWHHLQCYLAANNAMIIAALLVLPFLVFSQLLFIVSQSLSAIVFFIALMRIGSGGFGLGPVKLTGLLIASVLVTIPSTVLIMVLVMGSMEAVLQLNYGVSFLELMSISLDSSDVPVEAAPPSSATEE
ncbi:MAG: hypothetical protein ACQRW7_08865 [Caulobacterales bacterium]|uniref:hypothetical protein n=1 Tax=Glycocaulis sp. TaxID=1969725 RepID=UPI003F9F96AC